MRRASLAPRLFAAQMAVMMVTGLTLAATVTLVAPRLFVQHLNMTGEDSPEIQHHAREAFEFSFGVALAAAAVVSVLAAGWMSWLLAKRVSRPIEQLADAAESVARGNYDVRLPTTGVGRELTTLTASFEDMADRLAVSEASRTRLLADLSHEIRTPLATLEAHIDGLEDGIVEPSPQAYAIMRAQVDRLRRLSFDIKEVSAAQEHALDMHPRPARAETLVAAACDAAATRYHSKGVDLATGGSGCGTVLADEDRIQQVLANLLDNALRHTPAGGSVSVTCAQSAGHVTIAVADTGEGIPADELETVFNRFHRVDPARHHDGDGGSGLGLTIARAIVADHGGTLTASSAGPGQGTTMALTLPCIAEH